MSSSQIICKITELECNNTFAQIFLTYLEQQSVRRSDLAKAIHVSAGTISNWLSGERIPENSGFVFHIGEALHLNNEEKADLLAAWLGTRNLRDCAEYLRSALNSGKEDEALDHLSSVFRELISDEVSEPIFRTI